MKASELAAKALNVAKNYRTVYMWGVIGAPVTESVISAKTKQYPSWYTATRQALFRSLIGKGYFAFDCVCLIKSLLWGWSGDSSKTYGGAVYASNGVPDYSADGMIKTCSGVTTDFSRVEVGEALWMSGHIGIYIGNGLAVECTPKWANGVQITAVGNLGAVAGYNSRVWTKHGKLPYVTYDGAIIDTTGSTGTANTSGTVKVGDTVNFTGAVHYASANAAVGKACKPGRAKVTGIYQLGTSKHPYQLIREAGGTSTVYGWVDADDIEGIGTTPAAIKSGDTVMVRSGATTYVGGGLASFVYTRPHIVNSISGDRAVITYNGTIVAAVKVSDLTLA